MTPIIEDSILGTDLDGRFYDLLNVGALVPVPANLATSDHPGLSDSRPPIPGSVTDDSVADDAAIVQSKLSLDGQIPTAWLGTSSTTAAQGDLAEYLSNKNVPGGYAGLDATGKVPPANLPTAVGLGTVTSVGLTMPPQFGVSGSPVTGAGTLAVVWGAVADLSWFGNKEGASGQPKFYTDALPPSLIPALDASMVTSGVFAPARLPVAVGVGLSHASGAVPSPGDGTGPGVFPNDYLGRDMVFHNLPDTDPAYEPTLPNPVLTPDSTVDDPVAVMISLADASGNPLDDTHTVFFYSLTAAAGPFTEFPPEKFVHVKHPDTIYAYAAHAGYKNSAIVSLNI
jgi:hypothetical protein